jgi:intracellular septation protein A
LTGIALSLSMAGIYYTIDPFATGYRRARLGMNALTYGLALVLFLVVYRTRVRSIVSATEIMLLSGLLALELLRGSERPLPLVLLYAGITGLVLGQATWALNYWRLASLTGGLVLLVLFYDVVGLSQHALQGRINRRVLLEFGLITVAALALIWEFAP